MGPLFTFFVFSFFFWFSISFFFYSFFSLSLLFLFFFFFPFLFLLLCFIFLSLFFPFFFFFFSFSFFFPFFFSFFFFYFFFLLRALPGPRGARAPHFVWGWPPLSPPLLKPELSKLVNVVTLCNSRLVFLKLYGKESNENERIKPGNEGRRMFRAVLAKFEIFD